MADLSTAEDTSFKHDVKSTLSTFLRQPPDAPAHLDHLGFAQRGLQHAVLHVVSYFALHQV
eukprot:1160172-Pelagomonas_calceolata.AAC.8